MGNQSPVVAFMRLRGPSPEERPREYFLRYQPPREVFLLSSIVAQRVSLNEENVTPAWSSAANPFSTSIRFAVGFSGKIGHAVDDEDAITYFAIHHQDRIASVDWLDHNTIISGSQRGQVGLWDTRSNGQSIRFQYPGSINHVRKLEGSRVAIAGINESVSLFVTSDVSLSKLPDYDVLYYLDPYSGHPYSTQAWQDPRALYDLLYLRRARGFAYACRL